MSFRTYLESLRRSLSIGMPRRGKKARSQARTARRLGFDFLEDRVVPALAEPLGVIAGINGGGGPPDTVMDVGPNHVIQMVNSTQFQIWDKHGNSLAGPASFGALWSSGNPLITPDPGGLAQANLGDPVVVYDHLADRWLLSQFFRNAAQTTFGMTFAVSQTPDPVGGVDGVANNGDEWFLYRFDTPDFPDYPKIGVWQDAYYISTYENTTGNELGIYAFDRVRMLNGDAAANFVRTTIDDGAPAAGYRDTRIIPADLDGVAPPPGTPGYFVRTVDNNQDTGDARDRIEIYEARPNFVANTLTFTLIEDLDAGDGLLAYNTMRGNRTGVAVDVDGDGNPETIRDMIPQPGTIDTIDSLSNRPMMQLKFRNFGTHFGMVFNQTVDVQDFVQAETGFDPALEVAGIRWYELRSGDGGANWGIQQQGDYSPQPNPLTAENQILHRWMGSAAYDADGSIAIAYSVTNSDAANPVFPGIRYAARRFDDPAGQLAQGEQVIFNGTTNQGDNDANVEPQRWGDYSALTIDPSDDHKFWFSTHVANSVTQIAAFFIDASPPGFNFSNGILSVFGDQRSPGQNDTIRLVRDAADPTDLLVFVNGVGPIPDYRVPLAQVQQVNVYGFSGNDTLVVDSTNGPISVANGINYDGGGGFDRLDLTGGTATADTLALGATNGSGRSTIAFASGTQVVNFTNLEPVTDNVAAPTFTITSAADLASLLQTDNVITYATGTLLTSAGRVTVDAFEPIEFDNKTAVTIDAGAGADTVDLINTSTPTGLTGITVNAGSGNDTVTAAPGAVTPGLVVNGGSGNDTLSANGNLNGDSGNDTLIGGAGGNTLNGGAGEDVLDGRGGANILNGGADADTILVSGTAGADTITTTHGAGTFNVTGGLSAGTNTITDMDAVRVEAGGAADAITLNLLAAGGLNYTVLGGNPIGTLAGDSLTVNSARTMTVTAGPENDAGSVDAATDTPTNVSFDEIELLILGGGGGGVINGTNGNDAITIIARDESFNPAADGVQDFTAVVNAGLEILFLNQPTLTVNALGGSDTIVVRTPAPNNAAWDVDVTIDGGPPSAGAPDGSDRLVVETPGADAESVVYTPTASDAGTLNLTSLSSLLTFGAIEELLYDGEGDDDSLTVVGTGGADVITHTPGPTDQSGTFAVNGLLPIAYQNLGGAGSLTADGAGGSDVLVYLGTNADDTFGVQNAAGDVLLNGRLVLATAGVETLTMEGLLGDDLFDIVPPMPSLTYGRVNANGGGHASAVGDRTVLRATGGADDIQVSGQVVSLGGKTVASSGVEGISLDAAGGTDVVTYTGVAGVAEAINFVSSGVAGQGQISVPGVALVTFTGVEHLAAIGNTGAAGDEDTFTFTGTNAVDRFRINLAAAGTAADPVLLLQDASGSGTLLTLLDYTNFNTLRVNALEGEDVIDVYTAPGGPSRNLFVDGGEPNGKKKSTDKLTVYYTAPRPAITHSAATQNPDAGLVDLDYGTAEFLIQYVGIENVVIKRL